MANPIKASDLYEDDGAIAKLIRDLKEVNEQYQKLMAQIQKDAEAAAVGLGKLNTSSQAQREEITRMAKKS